MELKGKEQVKVKIFSAYGRYDNDSITVWAKKIFESRYIKVYEYINKHGYRRTYCFNKHLGRVNK